MIIDWKFLLVNRPIQLIESAASETGNGKVIEMKSPSLKTYSLWSFGFTLSQMAALSAAVYSIATSQRFRKCFRDIKTLDIFSEIAEKAIVLLIMANICIIFAFIGAEKLGLYNMGRTDSQLLNGK